MRGVQSSFGNVDAPTPEALVKSPWPVVDWGIEPAFPGEEGLDWPMGKEPIPGLRSEAGPVVLSLPSTKADIALNFGANRDPGLGPVVSVAAPPAGDAEITKSNGMEAGPMRLGNVTFNQAADSLNVWGSGTAKEGDLSRQLQTEATAPNVVQASTISAWAIVALAAFGVIVAMAIGYYENDRDDRKRRRGSRKSRRRHRAS